MFTVECPGCSGTYQVDARRIPAGGLRMRCPKCSTAFVVEKPTESQEPPSDAGLPAQVEKPDLPAKVTSPKAPAIKPALPPRPTVGTAGPVGAPPRPAVGTAASVPFGSKPTVEARSAFAPPVATPGKPPPPRNAPQAPPGPPPRRTEGAIDDLLPAVPTTGRVAPPRPTGLQGRPAASTKPEDTELPATRRTPTAKYGPMGSPELPGVAGNPSPLQEEGDELPARISRQQMPTEPMLPVASNLSGYDSDGDLPAALGAAKPLATSVPQNAPAKPTLRQERDFGELDFSIDLDLPGVVDQAGLPDVGFRDVGLPTVASERRLSPAGIELDRPSPTGHVGRLGTTQPTSVPPLVDDFEFELPSPMKAQKETLAGLPGLHRDLALDVSRFSAEAVGLPAVGVAELPVASSTGVGLPSVVGSPGVSTKTLSGTGSLPPASIPELDLGWGNSPSIPPGGPTSSSLGSLPPAFAGAGRASGSQPPGFGAEPAVSGNSLPPILGGANPPAISYQNAIAAGASDMELPIEPTILSRRRSSGSIPPSSSLEAQSKSFGAGGTSYGEVSLDATEDPLSVETEVVAGRPSLISSDALEFGAVPQAVEGPAVSGGDGGAATAAAASMRVASARSLSTVARSPRKASKVVYGLVGLAVLGGSALTLVPDIGPFGAHIIIDQVNRKDNLALVLRHAEAGRVVLARDDYSGVTKVLDDIEQARRDHERLKTLATYAAYFSYMTELRYGSQSLIHARAEVMLNELGERPTLSYFGLAQAARAAVEGNLARARRAIDVEVARDPRNVDALVLSAEIALLERRQAEALQQWQSADKLDPTARTAFGRARTLSALGRFEEAATVAHQTLERNPQHVGAELLLARLALDVKHDSDDAFRLVQSALKREGVASVNDFVQAKILSGDVNFVHSRISAAETSYQEALAKDPKSALALRGLGETLYRAGRYAEALARFEAGVQAAPDSIEVAVGVAKAQLALERIREALALLSRLRQANPKNYSVNYWYARANEAGGNRDEAEKAYEVAIEAGGTDPVVVDSYVGLALVKNQQGRREEAQKVLATAQAKLPKLPRIYEALGQLALTEGRYAEAVEQFKAALELSPSDVGVQFRLGVAHRKNRNFDAATKSFDLVAAVDRDYPGLALERGQLFEASGQTEEALRAFESALVKAPTDPDLMLRVGCGKVAAGRPEQAEELLKKVLVQRPTSAETHHCLGRAQLLQGSNLPLALRTLERAVELDPHRAEYLLYVGWAANEAGSVAKAEQALKKALELDQGLGDAYWQRGILRYRQGAIKDSVADLTRALELRPGRYEAHAALADAYFDLGLEAKALEQWQKATTAQPDNPTWAFRYGKLLQAAHREVEAKAALEKSIELTDKLTVKPRWIWEAHHLLARVIGHQPAAVKHWQAFLELSPRDNVYREEAKQILLKLGQPWTGD